MPVPLKLTSKGYVPAVIETDVKESVSFSGAVENEDHGAGDDRVVIWPGMYNDMSVEDWRELLRREGDGDGGSLRSFLEV